MHSICYAFLVMLVLVVVFLSVVGVGYGFLLVGLDALKFDVDFTWCVL